MIESIRQSVRSIMRQVAKLLNSLSGGRLHPNFVTLVGLLLHFVVAWAIIDNRFFLAGTLLVIFGLMDTLDGELARLQKRAGPSGMLLDATADRAKEIILYTAVGFMLIETEGQLGAVWAMLALGGSFLVSYSKAKGETALADIKGSGSANEINRALQDGLMRFEIRMLILVLGLLTGYLLESVMLVAILSWPTAIWRVSTISAKLSS